MKKIPVLILCNPETELAQKIFVSFASIPDIELVCATDLCGVDRQLVAQKYAFVVVDKTGGQDLRATGQCIRNFPEGKYVPLVFIVEDIQEAGELYAAFGSGTVDCLARTISVALFGGRIRLLVKLYRLRQRVRDQATELDSKILELEVLQKEVEEKDQRLELLSSLDPLTGLFNRHYFDDNLQKEWRQAVRFDELLSLLFVDTSYRKGQNKQYSRLGEEDYLCGLAATLHQALFRPVDIVARYGDERFAVILPGTNRAGAELVAERMLTSVASFNKDQRIAPVSGCALISIGGATTQPSAGAAMLDFIETAEAALVEANGLGQNRVCFR